MAAECFIHPCSIEVYTNPEYFNKPSTRWCNHCFQPCTHEPPKPLPQRKRRLGLDTGLQLQEERGVIFDAFECRKQYCDFHCLLAALDEGRISPVLVREMMFKCYRIPESSVVRKALPRWTLACYKGPLTWKEWKEWKITGVCLQAGLDQSGVAPDDACKEEERYQSAVIALTQLHPYLNTIFNPEDPIWSDGVDALQDLRCYNDGHVIDGACFTACMSDRNPGSPIDLHSVDPKWMQHLLFCSPACAIKHIHRVGGALRESRMFWTHELLKKYWARDQQLLIRGAPSRQLLQSFHGPLTIQEWRCEVPRFMFVRTAPVGRDWPCVAKLDQDLYAMVDRVFRWASHHTEPMDLVDASMKGFDALQHQNRDIYFPKRYHHIHGPASKLVPSLVHLVVDAPDTGAKIYMQLVTIEDRGIRLALGECPRAAPHEG